MRESLSPNWIGVALRELRAEQRSIRDENRLIHPPVGETTTVLLQRIGTFEAHADARLDQPRSHIAFPAEPHRKRPATR